jgi:hypothetical protein
MEILDLRIRASPGAHLSPVAQAAVWTGMGLVILGLIVGLCILLVRAKRNHQRMMADLEERGVVIAQSQKDAKRESVTKPRAVLRRNTILPFNAKSGWGTLSSAETIDLSEPPSVPSHYAPPKPAGFVSRSSRVSWPFSARRASGRNIHLRKIRVPSLSTVIESPKPSPLVPVLNGSLGGDPPTPRKNRSRPTSISSLLQRHPAFRNTSQDGEVEYSNAAQSEPLRRSLTANSATKTGSRTRPNRSRSVAEIPMSTTTAAVSQLASPELHARSASTCSQSSGNAPDAVVPPLPLKVPRNKSGSRKRSLHSRSPSRLSVSSSESVDSSVLKSSLILPRSTNVRVQKVTKRDWRNSTVVGPKPIRNTLTLHGKNQRSQSSIRSSAARFSSVTRSTQCQSQTESGSPTLTNSTSMQSLNVKMAESVTLSRVSSLTGSPYAVRSATTPKRKSGSYVNAYGSPEERHKGSYILQSVFGNHEGPQRQLSQASTQASSARSSNGNPFQWDPAPLSSGKPSALKGSPNACKGHRGQNCVRLPILPTNLNLPSRSRSPSPTVIKNIREESSDATPSKKKSSVELGFSNEKSLARPPSSPTFAPDVKFAATSIGASLSADSPTISLLENDHGPASSPLSFTTAPVLPHRLSTGSLFSISAFPSPCHGNGEGEPTPRIATPPPTFALSRPSNEYYDEPHTPDSPFGSNLSFDVIPPNDLERPFIRDEYDPEHPHLVHRIPVNSPATRNFSSPFSTIHEDSSATSEPTATHERSQSENSPPLSPKPLPRQTAQDPSAYNLPIKDTTIPEEYILDNIDPSIITRDAFTILNSGFDNRDSSIMNRPRSNRYGIMRMPNNTGAARSMFEPLFEAPFPSNLPTQDYTNLSPPSPSLKCSYVDDPIGRDPSSSIMLSLATSTSSPCISQAPCSPRPCHATLPTPALKSTDLPTFNHSLGGALTLPSSPLRSSIQQLRRMNSEAGNDGRCERRYLRLGCEDSLVLQEEESWLEELSAVECETETEEDWEGKRSRLVSSCLEDWDEKATILELVKCRTLTPTPTTVPVTAAAVKDDEVTPTNTPGKQQRNSGTSTPRELVPSSPNLGADRISSIWEDGEKYWPPVPDHARSSPDMSKQHYISLSSSPVRTKPGTLKREFEVAKDEEVKSKGQKGNLNKKKNKRGSRNRKRSVLGISTPNVNVQTATPPPNGGFTGTLGSPYDQEGFIG